MPDFEADLNYLRAGLESLEAYLLSDELYWATWITPKPGEAQHPSLTLGGLLLARARLSAAQLSDQAQVEREDLTRELDRIMSKWRVAWEKKAAREFASRLSLWRSFLEDYREQPESHADRYVYESSRRVMLDLLLPYVPRQVEAEREMLKGLDTLLKSIFVPGEFIWDETVKAAFPKNIFWYLYGILR